MPKGAKRKAKAEAEARAAAEAAGEDEDDDEYDEAPALELQAGEDDDEELQVEFSFFDPRSEDYHAMRAMLSGGALLPEGIDPGGFADLLSEQAVVGTLVKGESIDTDLYGFISALSLQQHKETKCVQQLIASILKRLPDAPAREAVRAWMQDAQAPLELVKPEPQPHTRHPSPARSTSRSRSRTPSPNPDSYPGPSPRPAPSRRRWVWSSPSASSTCRPSCCLIWSTPCCRRPHPQPQCPAPAPVLTQPEPYPKSQLQS